MYIYIYIHTNNHNNENSNNNDNNNTEASPAKYGQPLNRQLSLETKALHVSKQSTVPKRKHMSPLMSLNTHTKHRFDYMYGQSPC